MGAPFLGSVFVAKPLSQKHRSTFSPLQGANPTPSFGGFGLSGKLVQVARPTPDNSLAQGDETRHVNEITLTDVQFLGGSQDREPLGAGAVDTEDDLPFN